MRSSVDKPIVWWDNIPVETYAGYKADERPVAFVFRTHRYEITEIIDRWYEGAVQTGTNTVDYFKIRTSTGELFLLRHRASPDLWSLSVLNDPAAVVGVS